MTACSGTTFADRRDLSHHQAGPTLCSASKPYDKDDAHGQQGAGEPERDECLAPVRAVAHRLEDSDTDAPRVERPNERGDASKAERAESRRPGEGAPKHVATRRFKIPHISSILSIGMSSLGPNLIEEAEVSLRDLGVIDLIAETSLMGICVHGLILPRSEEGRCQRRVPPRRLCLHLHAAELPE